MIDHRSWFASRPIRRLTVLLDHVAPADADPYKQEIEAYETVLREAFEGLGFEAVEVWTDHRDLPRRLRDARPEFVLHMAEYGYKGSHSLFCCQIPACLEHEGIPFSNAGPRGMVFSSDKHFMNETLRAVGVPVATEVLLHRDDILKGAIEVPENFPFPGFLKTRLNGGSVGILPGGANIVASRGQIGPHFRKVIAGFTPDDVRGENMEEWLLQEFLPGSEWSVGVIGNGEDLDILPIGQLAIAGDVLDYGTSAEVASGGGDEAPPPERYVRARLQPADEQALIGSVTAAYAALACRDYARFDFRRDRHGVITLIDGNVLPGIYHGCAFVALAAMRGQSFSDLMREILGRSFDRCFPGWRPPSGSA